MERSQLNSSPAEDPRDETLTEAKSLRKMQLKQLMTEREGVVTKLVALDYAIWVLEESFRTGGA